jgi:hypothetical protein
MDETRLCTKKIWSRAAVRGGMAALTSLSLQWTDEGEDRVPSPPEGAQRRHSPRGCR